ncbi:hypothetical protein PORY_000242 [Pneumocystis oryctolagi]|uniref:Uncharacterized protein n=1 Tax=Pneumocystis oryctolagi TaxID=42067 RepID=A0ACB7CGR5_9ASCO|nr:hypothetical protein PORY_000242 [Pneumocystis oryctolagi]
MMDCELKYSRWIGWLRRIFRRIEDHRLERKFRAGIRYSEYSLQIVEKSAHTPSVLTCVPAITAHKYGENGDVKKSIEKVQTSNCEMILPVQETQNVSEMCPLVDNASVDRLSYSNVAVEPFETRSIDVGSPIVSLSATSTPAPARNSKCLLDVCRTSIDTNASMRALAPSSRQSSCSSFSSAWTSKLGMLFLSEAAVVY